ncbi:TPA_asm: hypothetical protein [ssRNA phage Esthiorhiza.2_51]|uniref:Uncharacterized protein n=2 Tax=Fiersviridae TaxID=2842319 RepID=A0A8S5L0X5_9VIRU|nr:hypothetical protein QIK70_gp1 [ssRNA phage Esthiorhiza.2_51]QDH90702.1 MAG: hypothetical protein H2RhizoLitter8480_000005 [Leviviridae sp.]DAD51558.1 TPA_asm: hypothetical protein [ssRNA phage Esthiorhiza.2_51]
MLPHYISTLSGVPEVEAIMASAPPLNGEPPRNRLFALLSALRDRNEALENTVLNERVLISAFANLSSDEFRDAFDRASALAFGSELDLLTAVLLFFIRRDGGHACLPL